MKILRYTLIGLFLLTAWADAAFAQTGCLEGDCENGWGVYAFSSGSRYEGYFKDNKRNGYGYYRFSNKDEYIGDWKDNKRHGSGTYRYASKGMYRKYIGEWRNNKRDGIGIMIMYNGINKLGNWKDNSFLGKVNKGKMGCVSGDCKNGFGTYVLKDGAIYRGQYKGGKRNGFGTYYYPKGGKFSGYQVDGKRNGIGVYFYPSGNRYIGDWSDELKEGEGILLSKGKIQQMGYWVGGKFMMAQEVRKDILEKAGLLNVNMSSSILAMEDNNIKSPDKVETLPREKELPKENIPTTTPKEKVDKKPIEKSKDTKKNTSKNRNAKANTPKPATNKTTIKPNNQSSKTDVLGPTITLTKPYFKNPRQSITVDEGKIMVAGTAIDDGGVVSVRVNGIEAILVEGKGSKKGFATEVKLREGTNIITVDAEDEYGNKQHRQYRVVYEVIEGFIDTKQSSSAKNSRVSDEKRTALVIGNGEYMLSPLRNAPNDAKSIAKSLEELGFDVILQTDLDQKEMKRAIRDFGTELKENGGVGLFYYAGHGLQVQGENYLLPVKADVEKELDIELESVRLQRILNELEWADNRMNIVVLDACRDNPYNFIRSLNDGLAPINRSPNNTYIAYSTSPGKSAADGEGKHGLFTQELLDVLENSENGVKLEDIFKRVRKAVREKSNGNQVPWDNSSIEGDFYFKR